ncbi:MAG: heterodisulfide reductase subunit B [Peptococcaceae bacterium]|nr:heterodisulfide reductase subunit B [Peptococcaceae bacterium]
MEFSYYPGCSLESSAKEYNQSAMAVAKALGITLNEIEDWVCCGATSAHSTNHKLSYALPAINISLAQNAGNDIVVPCASCYSRLKKTDLLLRNNPEERKEIEDIADFNYEGKLEIVSVLELFAKKLPKEELKSKVKKNLSGLKLACYYGCLTVRPPEICFENPENPDSMDTVMKAIGAEPVRWSYKTECCGASLSLTATGTVNKMVARIVDMAAEAGANAIVTACPLCQMNLEVRRNESNSNMPVFYFTELIALALGIPECKDWFAKHIVDPRQLLKSLSLI